VLVWSIPHDLSPKPAPTREAEPVLDAVGYRRAFACPDSEFGEALSDQRLGLSIALQALAERAHLLPHPPRAGFVAGIA